MAAVQAGDLRAFETLYARHHRAVFGVLLRSVADRRTAEDLLQETFLRVFASRRAYRPLAAFRTWLYTIARHLVVDQMRRAAPVGALTEDLPDEVPDAQASPLERVEAEAVAERLAQAVARLPPGQREVLLLSRVARLTHEGGGPGDRRLPGGGARGPPPRPADPPRPARSRVTDGRLLRS